MDRLDRKILRLLQEDSTLAVADLAKKVGLSTTPCWRRIQKMEEDGVIRGRVALLDPEKVNTKVTVFVSIRTNTHSIEWLKRFSEVVAEFPGSGGILPHERRRRLSAARRRARYRRL